MTVEERAIVQSQLKYLFVSIVFGAGAYFLFGGLFRSAVLFVAVIICLLLNFARRWLMRGGLLFLALIFLVIFDIVPPPAAWGNSFRNVSFDVCPSGQPIR